MDRVNSVLLLGTGYTGEILACRLLERGSEVTVTRRSWSPVLRRLERVSRAEFDLNNPASWASLPAAEAAAWLFPAEPLDRVAAFAPLLFERVRRYVVIGTTSSYRQDVDDQLLTESSPLDMLIPRVQGEEFLRSRGALVLRSAGIYGPGRNPLDWLRGGNIAGGNKFINLIHVDDLATAIIAALDSTIRGEQFIVSDGKPRRWESISEWALAKGFIPRVHYASAGTKRSRELSNAKLLEHLKPGLRHVDLFAEIEQLERKDNG